MWLLLKVAKLAVLLVLFCNPALASAELGFPDRHVPNPKYIQVPGTVLAEHHLRRTLFKLNDLYIFFTGPDGPFVRADGELIISLKACADIFNATIDRAKDGKVYLSWPTYHEAKGRVVYTPNDSTALYRNRPIKTGFKPTYLHSSQTLYVSAKPVLQALGLKVSYDQTLKMMHATGQELYSVWTGGLVYMPRHPYKTTTKLIPRSFHMTATWNVEVILAQRPGVNIAQGHQGLYMLVSTPIPGGYTIGGPGAFPALDGVPASTDPCKKQEHIFVCKESYTGSTVGVIVAKVSVKP